MEIRFPTESTFAVLKALSRAGFGYSATKAICDASGWQLLEDKLDSGFLRYSAPIGNDSLRYWVVTVMVNVGGRTGSAFVPLFFFEDYSTSREPFDAAFHQISDGLSGTLGEAQRAGGYSHAHRPNWQYLFTGWSLPEATIILVQDEFDIQFGMDVTLWVRPAGAPIDAPIR